jgi:hypothetical protein
MMRAGRRQDRFPGIRLAICALVTLIWVHAAHAVPVWIFTGCRYAASLVMHESLQELGLVVEELSAARSDRSRDVIGRETRETLACDVESEDGIFDLFLGDPEEAARANLDMEQVWGITLAVDERVLFEEGTQGRRTDPPVPGFLAGTEE